MREIYETNTDIPVQPQRWWVDYLHNVQTGRLVDTMSGKAVVTSTDGFNIIDIDQLKTTYADACVEAINRLSKAQQDINIRLAALMGQMAKATSGK